MTGPELFELGSSIIANITKGDVAEEYVAAQAAVAAACFTGSQAAAFAVMAAMELDGEDDAMAKAWGAAVGLTLDADEDGDQE